MNHTDYLTIASSAFLCTPLPEHWEYMNEEDSDNFLIDNAWEPFQDETPASLYALISDHADYIRDALEPGKPSGDSA